MSASARRHRPRWIGAPGPIRRGPDWTSPRDRSYRCPPMAPRGEVHIKVSFGPTPSPLLAHAVSFAREHASGTEDLGSGTFEASFTIGLDEHALGELHHLLCMVGSWKTTRVEVSGSLEHPRRVLFMLSCARRWLVEEGSCGAWFPFAKGAPRCKVCPSYDSTYAQEFWIPPSTVSWLGGEPHEVPDHVPDEWSAG